MTRILLIGPNGQVGWELQRTLMPLGQVLVAGRTVSDKSLQVDLSQPASILHVIKETQPKLIINAAAYTAVDKAESEPDLAMAVNGVAPGVLAEAAKAVGAALVHYSTDYVFSGNQNQPYTETDTPDPKNVYGRTKLAGEEAIQAVGVPHLIFRTSWVYGLRGKNFLLTVLKLAKEREELRVVNDQVGAPTWSRLIAETTALILAQGVRELPEFCQQRSGIYHLTATGKTTWYDFTKAILILDRDRQSHQIQQAVPIPTEQYPTPANRPKNTVLDSQKLRNTFGLLLPDWYTSLKLAME